MKLIDAVGIALIILGAAMTALCFLVKGPEPTTMLQLNGSPIFYGPQNYYDYRYQRARFFTTAPPHHQSDVYSPWRMRDWATCLDGTQIYERNEQYPTEPPMDPPCLEHGGLRAYGPGRRLNEK